MVDLVAARLDGPAGRRRVPRAGRPADRRGGRRAGGRGRRRRGGRALRAVRRRAPQGRRPRGAGPGPAAPPRRALPAGPRPRHPPGGARRGRGAGPRRPGPRFAARTTASDGGGAGRPGVDRPRRLRRVGEVRPPAGRRPGAGPGRAGVRGHDRARRWTTRSTGPTGWAPAGWRWCPLFLFPGVLVDRIARRGPRPGPPTAPGRRRWRWASRSVRTPGWPTWWSSGSPSRRPATCA